MGPGCLLSAEAPALLNNAARFRVRWAPAVGGRCKRFGLGVFSRRRHLASLTPRAATSGKRGGRRTLLPLSRTILSRRSTEREARGALQSGCGTGFGPCGAGAVFNVDFLRLDAHSGDEVVLSGAGPPSLHRGMGAARAGGGPSFRIDVVPGPLGRGGPFPVFPSPSTPRSASFCPRFLAPSCPAASPISSRC